MFRKELAEKAKAYYEDMQKRLSKETAKAIQESTIYGPDPLPQPKDKTHSHYTVELVALDSVSCAFEQVCEGKTAILNFASYKNPGGFFLGGSPAQEEGLCHESNLYPILLSFENTYYAENKKHLNKSLYQNRAIYTPNVVFEHNRQRKEIDVLTCAAPNYYAAHKYKNVGFTENDRVFSDRINFMFDVADYNKVDTLIAGAWGCGVFGQHPGRACTMMLNTLASKPHHIKKVYFAIPNPTGRNPNYIQFEKVINLL